MAADLRISEIRYSPASAVDISSGLLGFASFLLNDAVRVDGVAVRRRLDGALTLAWPARTDRDGKRHPYLRPIDDDARRDLERQVFTALGLTGRQP